MNDTLIKDTLNRWALGYSPRKVFPQEDYANLGKMKYVPDNKADALYNRVVEEFTFMPKPADVRKVAMTFMVFPDKPKQQDDLDATVCFMPECNKPVFDPRNDPYLCQLHHDRDIEYRSSIKTNYKRVEIKNSVLDGHLNKQMEKYQ